MTERETEEQVLARLLQLNPRTFKETTMTQRERIRDENVQPAVGVYDTDDKTTTRNTSRRDKTSDPDVTAPASGDLIRWGPVLAGLFAALATLITLSVLGLAIGLNAFDPNTSNARNFGLGAGLWGAITALLSFFVGGWLAGRSAKFAGSKSGILNGAMVWFVAIPLLVYLLSSGIGSLINTAGSVAGTAVTAAGQAAGAAAGQAADNPAVQATAAAGADAAGQAAANAAATAQATVDQVTPQQVEDAANTAANGAWGTLLSLGLAAAAAVGGGYLGAQQAEANRRYVKP